MFPQGCKLAATGPDSIPLEIHHGALQHRTDLTTTYEEANIIIAQQMTYLGLEGIATMHVILDDIDVSDDTQVTQWPLWTSKLQPKNT